MRKLTFTFSRVALNQIYLSYLLPNIEYLCVVMAAQCKISILSVGCHLQKDAGRKKKLIFMYKPINDFLHIYASYLIPPSIGEISTYTLRNQHACSLLQDFYRTEISRKSCIPSSISVWNSLKIELSNSPSLASFKYQLKNHQNNSRVPTYKRTGSRYLSVLHARIRNIL